MEKKCPAYPCFLAQECVLFLIEDDHRNNLLQSKDAKYEIQYDQQCYRPYLFEGVLKVVRIGDERKSRDYRTYSILGLTDLLQKEGK